MSEPKRECASCQFFQNAQMAGNGWCTHPKRQIESGLKILVRSHELACRNDWGESDWMANTTLSHTTTCRPSLFRHQILRTQARTDEVTSITDSSASHAIPPPVVDDVVTHTAVRAESSERSYNQNDLNEGAMADQEQRAQAIHRGYREAIQQARIRGTERRAQQRPMIAPDPSPSAADPEPNSASDVTPAAPSAPALQVNPVLRNGVQPQHIQRFFGSVGPVSKQEQPAESAFEYKLRMAELLKSANAEFSSGVSQRGYMYGRDTAPEVDRTETVERAQLNDAVSRVRDAIFTEATPALEAEPVEHGAFQDEPIPSPAVTSRVEIASALPDVDIDQDVVWIDDPDFAYDEPDMEANTAISVEAEWVDEEDYFDEPFADAEPVRHEMPARPAPRRSESPKGSWWRRGNFNLRRRYQPEPEVSSKPLGRPSPEAVDRFSAREEYVEEWTANTDEYVVLEDDWTDEPYAAQGDTTEIAWPEEIDEDESPLAASDDQFEDELTYEYAEAEETLSTSFEEPERAFITSEDSWLEDAHSFPAAQPASWHAERSRLLASRWETPELPAPIVFDRLEEEVAPPAPAVRDIPSAPRPRTPRPTFSIDDPGGMQAFREALFATRRGAFDLNDRAHHNQVVEDWWEDEAVVEERQVVQPRAATRRSMEPAGDPSPSRRPQREQRPIDDRYLSEPEYRTSPLRARHITDPYSGELKHALSEDEPDRKYAISANMTKSCATCRSFQPSEDGSQGRCANDHSSTFLQVVQADELACHSSMGNWWLAADTAWIPPVDRVVPQTPRANRLIANADQDRSHRPDTGRGVRTRKVV